MDMVNNVVIAGVEGRREWVEMVEGIEGIKCDEKN